MKKYNYLLLQLIALSILFTSCENESQKQDKEEVNSEESSAGESLNENITEEKTFNNDLNASYQFNPVIIDSSILIEAENTKLLNCNDSKVFGLSLKQIILGAIPRKAEELRLMVYMSHGTIMDKKNRLGIISPICLQEEVPKRY